MVEVSLSSSHSSFKLSHSISNVGYRVLRMRVEHPQLSRNSLSPPGSYHRREGFHCYLALTPPTLTIANNGYGRQTSLGARSKSASLAKQTFER
jgi:hypothetical protein